jgi:hypothetical protein
MVACHSDPALSKSFDPLEGIETYSSVNFDIEDITV